MKKLLVLFSSALLIFTSINISNFSQLGTKINNSHELKFVRKWFFKSINTKQFQHNYEWSYFAIDNINLSSIGIKSIDELNSYNVIEIPRLNIRCDNILVLSGDKWNPKIRTLKPEKWHSMLNNNRIKWSNIMNLESGATLWYSDDEDLMMLLAYCVNIQVKVWLNIYYGGLISYKTGSCIKFY